MEVDLHALFERALDDEPPAWRGDAAGVAIDGGTRLRRRRRLLRAGTTGLVALLAAGAWHVLAPAGPAPAAPLSAASAQQLCAQIRDRSEVVLAVFLRSDVTDRQRDDIDGALSVDARVGDVLFESHAEAYARFASEFRDAPHGIDMEALPAAFFAVVDGSRVPALSVKYRRMAGVVDVIDQRCLLHLSVPAGR
jgi:hypothetical protein